MIVQGIEQGIRPGILQGLNPGRIAVLQDGPDGWWDPQSADDFTAIGAAVPDQGWLCNETSAGNLAAFIDSLGTGALVEQAAGSGMSYDNAIAGWAMRFVGMDGSVNSQGWRDSGAALDLAASESFAIHALLAFTTPAATRAILTMQGATNRIVALTSGGHLRGVINNQNANLTIEHAGITAVRRCILYRNAALNESGIVTDLEKVTCTHDESAQTGQAVGIGPSNASAAPVSRVARVWVYKGVNAERDWEAEMDVLCNR